MELRLLFWFLQALPEALALTSLAVVLVNRKLEVKSILFIGLSYAMVVYLVRLMPVTFGVHFILLIVILAGLLTIYLKRRFSWCLLSALVACLVLAVSETTFIFFFSLITGITIEQLTLVRNFPIYYGWPHIVFLFLLALTVNRWHRTHHEQRGESDDSVPWTEPCR